MSRKAVYDLSNDKSHPKHDVIENCELLSEHEDPQVRQYHGPEEMHGEFGILDRDFSYENLSKNQTISKFATFQSLHQIGIFGWRRTSLYILLFFTIFMTILNVSMTGWILMRFNIDSNGFLGLDVTNTDRININKDVYFSRELRSDNIIADESLKIVQKNGSLTLSAGGSKLQIFPSRIVAVTDNFLVQTDQLKNQPNSSRMMSLNAYPTEQSVSFSVQKFTLNDTNSLRIPQQLQTPSIDSGINRGLTVYSPQGSILINAHDGVSLLSKLGPATIISSKNLKVRSSSGTVTLESSNGIYFRNLESPNFTGKPQRKTAIQKLKAPTVYQLCICDNGKLFVVDPQQACSIQSNSDCF